MSAGHIYIMSNTEVPHLLKIGHTTRTINERARELSSGAGVPGSWQSQESWLVSDSYKFEQIVHKELVRHRKGGIELYKLDIKDAIVKVSVILRNSGAIGDDGLSQLAKIRAELERNDVEIKSIKEALIALENAKKDLLNRREALIKRLNSRTKDIEYHSKPEPKPKYNLIEILLGFAGLMLWIIIPGAIFFLIPAAVMIAFGFLTGGGNKREQELLNEINIIKSELSMVDNNQKDVQDIKKKKYYSDKLKALDKRNKLLLSTIS